MKKTILSLSLLAVLLLTLPKHPTVPEDKTSHTLDIIIEDYQD